MVISEDRVRVEDMIARLRNKADRILRAQDSRVSESVAALLIEAADEIERLGRTSGEL